MGKNNKVMNGQLVADLRSACPLPFHDETEPHVKFICSIISSAIVDYVNVSMTGASRAHRQNAALYLTTTCQWHCDLLEIDYSWLLRYIEKCRKSPSNPAYKPTSLYSLLHD